MGDLVYSHTQHEWHVWLHWISVGICCIFALQIFVLMLCYRLEFFKVKPNAPGRRHNPNSLRNVRACPPPTRSRAFHNHLLTSLYS